MSVETPARISRPQKHPRSSVDASEKRAVKRARQEQQAAAGSALSFLESGRPKKKRRLQPARTEQPLQEAKQIDAVKQSPFRIQTTSLYLPLSPIAQAQPLEGLCGEHLSPLLLTYYPPLKGVVLSYHNVRLSNQPAEQATSNSETLGRCSDQYAVTFVWVTVDFVIFRPEKGIWMEGYINVQNESHIGLVCWNLFNASIERKRFPTEWKWIPGSTGTRSTTSTLKGDGRSNEVDAAESWYASLNGTVEQEHEVGGYFTDEYGQRIEGKLSFRISDFESLQPFGNSKAFLSIDGTLLDP